MFAICFLFLLSDSYVCILVVYDFGFKNLNNFFLLFHHPLTKNYINTKHQMSAKNLRREGIAWPFLFWNGKLQQNNPAEIWCLVFGHQLMQWKKHTENLKKWKEKEQKKVDLPVKDLSSRPRAKTCTQLRFTIQVSLLKICLHILAYLMKGEITLTKNKL